MTNYYKRYIYKNGIKHSPYYYSNKKVDGKVISTYLGTEPPKNPEFRKPHKLNTKFLIIFLSLISLVLLIYLAYYFELFSTGKQVEAPEIETISEGEIGLTNETNITLATSETIEPVRPEE